MYIILALYHCLIIIKNTFNLGHLQVILDHDLFNSRYEVNLYRFQENNLDVLIFLGNPKTETFKNFGFFYI